MEASKVDLIDATYKRCAEELTELNRYACSFLGDMNNMRNNLMACWSQENERKQRNILDEVELENFTTRLDVVRIMAQKLKLQFKFYSYNFMQPDQTPYLYMQSMQYKSLTSNESQLQLLETKRATIQAAQEQEKNVQDEQANKTVACNRNSIDIYAKKDMSGFVIGTTFRANITYIEDTEELIFYVCPVQDEKLSALCKMRNLPTLWRLPSTEELFGIAVSDEEIWRAIRLNDKNDILLIDIGEVVTWEKDCKLFRLPEDYMHLPPQAFRCQLVNVVYKPNYTKKDMSNILISFEYKSMLFRVTRIESGTLHVEILSSIEWSEDDCAQNQTVDKSADYNDTHIETVSKAAEEYDNAKNAEHNEIVNKSNPFIDWRESDEDTQKFKESACTTIKALELKIDNSAETRNNQEVSKDTNMHNGDIVKVLVTHISDIITFYAQTAEENKENIHVCWDDDDLDYDSKLTAMPAVGDLLLAKYSTDNLWYRARVTAVNQQTKLITVFFVDFGNEETVRLDALASCTNQQKALGFRAVRFIVDQTSDTIKHNYAMHKRILQALSVILLNEEVELKVLYLNEMDDLVVKFVDIELQKTIELLLADGNFAKTLK